MPGFGHVFRYLRKSQGLSQKEMAQKLGISFSMYERGEREPNFDMLEAIADYFNVDMDYLLGKSNVQRRISYGQGGTPIPPGFEPLPEMVSVPLVGRIACGTPILAQQNVKGAVAVPSQWHAQFVLTCRGDSMAPTIKDGDLVAIRPQPEVENGQIAAVRIGDEATLKRVYLSASHLELRPENPSYQSIVLIGEEMNTVKIEGRAVGLCRAIQ